jgi:hypothetical protein
MPRNESLGFDDDQGIAPVEKPGEPNHRDGVNREAERDSTLRSLKRASCFRRKIFSAISLERAQNSKRKNVSKAIL